MPHLWQFCKFKIGKTNGFATSFYKYVCSSINGILISYLPFVKTPFWKWLYVCASILRSKLPVFLLESNRYIQCRNRDTNVRAFLENVYEIFDVRFCLKFRSQLVVTNRCNSYCEWTEDFLSIKSVNYWKIFDLMISSLIFDLHLGSSHISRFWRLPIL